MSACGFVPPNTAGYAPCHRTKGHEGPCAHEVLRFGGATAFAATGDPNAVTAEGPPVGVELSKIEIVEKINNALGAAGLGDHLCAIFATSGNAEAVFLPELALWDSELGVSFPEVVCDVEADGGHDSSTFKPEHAARLLRHFARGFINAAQVIEASGAKIQGGG